MRRQRRTKVVATLGPASSSRTVISRLFEAGADVFRINMSHTNHDKMRELVETIRAVEAECDRPIGILVDLQGPKLRLGSFKNDWAEIDAGQDFILDTDPAPGDATRVNLPHPEIFAAIKPGDTLLIDDGKLRLVVTEAEPQRIVARVKVGGKISNRKGVSLPDTVVPVAALAAKDLADLEAALDAGIDWVALSFIQRPEDVAEAKKITRGRAAVMAKIEKPQAVTRLERYPRSRRRADGGARRPRRRDAAGKSARRAEGNDARLPPRRQAGHRRDADAGIDDHQPGADPRRSLRRCHRHLRRRRRGHAVGGIGRRANIRSKRWRR